MQRLTGSVSFEQDFYSYMIGFGSYSSDFWLGLDKIYALTNTGNTFVIFALFGKPTVQRRSKSEVVMYVLQHRRITAARYVVWQKQHATQSYALRNKNKKSIDPLLFK